MYRYLNSATIIGSLKYVTGAKRQVLFSRYSCKENHVILYDFHAEARQLNNEATHIGNHNMLLY